MEVGRDGCRVPLPWEATPAEGSSFGFGPGAAHLPQPAWFADFAAGTQAGDPASTLTFYRSALALRRELQGGESLEWLDSDDGVLHFVRPGGWHVVANFGDAPVELPAGEVLLESAGLEDGRLPGAATAWIRA